MLGRIQRAATAGPLIVGLVALACVAGGCRGSDVRPEPVPVSSPTVAPVDGPVAFHLRLGAGQRLTMRTPEPDRCPALDALIDLGSGGSVRLAAYATSCAGDQAAPGNGRHGTYRTTADIAADRGSRAVSVHTALGEATVFDQPYYECTNSCEYYTEPVAVIMLDRPGDPAIKALIAYSAKGSIGLDRLTALVRDQLLA